jgi:Zn-dependent M28 family amino/carboxypeptidase
VSATRGFAAGHGCTVLETHDGGASWQSLSENLPEGAVIYAKNVVATLPGTVGDEHVVICGHYDSATFTDPMNLAPGADDNASGTSAVLAAAKHMRANSYERTVEFICFGGEEQGMRGSRVYAANARRSGMNIAAVVNLDMIAYSDGRPEPADLVCNPESEWLVDFSIDCGAVYVPTAPTRKVVNATITASDHSPFWDAGYSAMFGHEDIPQVTPYIHTEGDTLGTLAQWFLKKFTKIALATVAELAIPDTTTSGVTASAVSAATIRAYPNPFSSATTLSFVLAADGKVSIDIFDVEGRRLRTLAGGRLSAGRNDLVWDGEDASGARVSAGIYFARVRSGDDQVATKVVLLD